MILSGKEGGFNITMPLHLTEVLNTLTSTESAEILRPLKPSIVLPKIVLTKKSLASKISRIIKIKVRNAINFLFNFILNFQDLLYTYYQFLYINGLDKVIHNAGLIGFSDAVFIRYGGYNYNGYIKRGRVFLYG